MAKKIRKPLKTCADCIHEFACSMWNIGYIHEMDATNCVNYETVKDSASYLIGRMDERRIKMGDKMAFPDSVEEFMEQYKMTDTEHVYSNGTEYVPIYRMKQWFEHCRNIDTV